MSLRKTHVKTKVHRIKPKWSIFRSRWFWFVLSILAIVSSLFYFLLFFPNFQVKNVLVSGNSKIDASQIKNLIYNNFWFWSSKSVFLVSPSKLQKEILNNYAIVESVKIKRILPQTIAVEIAERKAVGYWCDSSSQCFFIDKSGIIFEPYEDQARWVFIVRQSNDGEAALGKQIIGQNTMDSILKIVGVVSLDKVLIKSSARIDVTTNEGWLAYFDLNSSIDQQIGKLSLLLEKEITPLQRENLYYIDLRPKDRAIVCDNPACANN